MDNENPVPVEILALADAIAAQPDKYRDLVPLMNRVLYKIWRELVNSEPTGHIELDGIDHTGPFETAT